MRRRCYNPAHKDYAGYAGRGIEVRFADWAAFRSWALTAGWQSGLVIDRIDNNGHYEPSNLRWVTWAESNGNKKRAV